jgi:hypothetical protein
MAIVRLFYTVPPKEQEVVNMSAYIMVGLRSIESHSRAVDNRVMIN